MSPLVTAGPPPAADFSCSPAPENVATALPSPVDHFRALAATAARPPPAPPQKTVIDAQIKALEKAKALNGVERDAAETAKKIEDAGG